jgi:hypothetical protein
MTSSNTRYALDLVQAGMQGIRSTPRPANLSAGLVSAAWAPAALGALVGASAVSFDRRHSSLYDVARGGFVGSMVGIGCSVAWRLGKPTGAVVRNAWRGINQVRDAQWLEKNPIDYA